MTHHCRLSCELSCEWRELLRRTRSQSHAYDVHVEEETADGDIVEKTYRVWLRWDSGGGSASWWMTDVQPKPPNEWVSERVHELAAQKADDAVNAALDREGWE